MVSLVVVVGVMALRPTFGPMPLDQFHHQETGGEGEHDGGQGRDGGVDVADRGADEGGSIADPIQQRGHGWNHQDRRRN